MNISFALKKIFQKGGKFAFKRSIPAAPSIFRINNYFNFSTSGQPQNNEPETHDDFKPKAKTTVTNENAHQLIEQWVKGNKVVLFMKGSPQMPMCGYSNFAVEILKFYKIKDYYSVDILKDAILREAVKKYSNWPTYPQLYVEGNLIGGSDILSEMHKEGSLKELFQKAGLI